MSEQPMTEAGENLLGIELKVDADAQRYLAITARWAKFLGVSGFVFSGILAIYLVFGTFELIRYNSGDNDSASFVNNSMMNSSYAILLAFGFTAAWFLTSLFTYRFARQMKMALQGADQFIFNDALRNLAKNYRFLGTVTIIYMILLLLTVLAFIFIILTFSR